MGAHQAVLDTLDDEQKLQVLSTWHGDELGRVIEGIQADGTTDIGGIITHLVERAVTVYGDRRQAVQQQANALGTITHRTPAAGELDLTPIQALHRGGDGYVAFADITKGNFKPLFSVRADELPGWFPAMQQHLLRDGTFTINAFFRSGKLPSLVEPKLKSACRHTKDLKYLNACFIDLDAHAIGITEGQVIGRVHDAIQSGALPAVSMYSFSGGGVWLFWMLRDDQHPDQPVRAFPEKQELFARIQQAIIEQLSDLNPDAKDAARLCRVPGSENVKRDKRVRFMITADENGKPFVYTLNELAELLKVERPERHAKVQQILDDGTREIKRRAWQELQANRLRQFEDLRTSRRKFREGCRNHAAMLHTHFLNKNKVPPSEIWETIERFAFRDCVPPLSAAEVKAAFHSGMKMKTGQQQINNRTIADWLSITPEEAEKLKTWEPARCYGGWRSEHELPVKATRKEQRQARHKLITEITATREKPASLRVLKSLLKDVGHEVSHVTLKSDYEILNILSEASQRRQDAENLDLFDLPY